MRDGVITTELKISDARETCRASCAELPLHAMKLSPGEPAIETVWEK
jgi:hypothetical protein